MHGVRRDLRCKYVKIENLLYRRFDMFIYDNLKELDSSKDLAVSPLEYVVLECGR